VLHRELFFQSGREMLVVWVRLRQLLPSLRAAYKDPNYMRNLETVGQEFADYMKAADPDAYEAFVARIS
jgi:hypothetical protein